MLLTEVLGWRKRLVVVPGCLREEPLEVRGMDEDDPRREFSLGRLEREGVDETAGYDSADNELLGSELALSVGDGCGIGLSSSTDELSV